ncbi:hypothetical protein BXZ70DRAFT_211572 [Cristinia sonorae]|uniref:Uncharacterized protein n=1 Tax=Cristinia sonorae TaxID=1940300 RepID=A0A8K0XNZ3_9AGAR|nr:hypothetical protein BXZ70DRAFT_211572 [Cristinia sonorae]
MHPRGRSREVSQIALARRTCILPSTSPDDPSFTPSDSDSPHPSPPEPLTPPDYTNLDYYDSPPSPPRTLQDQMQVAYALDNMHLAKVLLLKLQGIDVTSDNDPRIAQVKDVDFNDAFVPPGGLMLEEDIERRCRDAEKREAERRRRRAREEKLRACEQIWDNTVRCMREDKERVARRKEDRLREKRRFQIEAREREREAREREAERAHDSLTRHTRQLRLPAYPSQRAVLSYGSLPASSSRLAPPSSSKSPPRPRQQEIESSFQYAIMQPFASPAASTRHLSSSPKSPLRAYNDFAAQSRSVTFSDVVASMRGPLFPLGLEEEERSTLGRNAAQVKLFDELLRPARWDGEDSRSRIRPKAGMPGRRRSTDECVACSLDSASLCPSSSSSSRTAVSESARTETTVRSHTSWFSFSVRSSISTLLTTPSLSPLMLSKDMDIQVVEEQEGAPIVIRHSCPRSTRVIAIEHPLIPEPARYIHAAMHQYILDDQLVAFHRPRLHRASSSTRSLTDHRSIGFMTRMSQSVRTFVDIATSFQRAYVSATMFNTGVDGYGYDWDEESSIRSRSRSRSRGVSVVRRRGRESRSWRVRKEGYRASAADVSIFIATPPCQSTPPSSPPSPTSPSSPTTQPRPPIPLYPLNPPPPPIPSTSSTLAIERKLPPPAQPPRSPFRLPYPPPTVTSRLRPIANPLLLRVKALQNACGVGGEKVSRMGNEVKEVKEKMVGVAWEGIGRSGLGWEVSVC